ncbi:MAG TPA: beta-ketoacyl-ACP synthase III [Candidatus Dormibacteraeota bacterium]|nr:beta-ketoacyl-ACP synthase III [Candidatus Dormibacteraeota bacterium]
MTTEVMRSPRVRSGALPLRAWRPQGRAAAIAGIGVDVPERVVTNADLEKVVDTSDQWIRERTGIERRRLAEEGAATFELATRAARAALADAGVEAEEVDLIIASTSSPDGPFPSVACRVQEQLGAYGCPAYDLLAACSGFIYGLSAGEAAIATGRAETVLVIGAEVLSRLVDWTDRSTCVLFSDGAGAAVLRPAERGAGFLGWCLGADGRGYDQITYGDVAKGAWAASDKDPRIGMKGPDVFRFANEIFIRQAFAVAEAAGIEPSEIDLWVPHQANGRIIEAAARRIGLPMERVMVTVQDYGNNSTATIPMALRRALDERRIEPGHKVLLAGFGSGLTWGSCLLEWE